MSFVVESDHAGLVHRTAISLGAKLRWTREDHGYSQEDVAFRAGIAVHTYRALEVGRAATGCDVNPTLDTLLRVFEALDLPIPVLDVARVRTVL